MKTNDEPVVVIQTFEAPVETLWRAITEIGRMRQWYFEALPSFRPEVGFRTRFRVISGGRSFTHLWEITCVEPRKRIAYRWRYEEYPGEGRVEFELSEGESTRLKLTNHGLESFPDGIPEFSRENCRAGWEYFIQDRLKAYVERSGEAS